MQLKGNKGEWSELYVLLALLAEGKLFAADENVKRIDSVFFPILKILRAEQKKRRYEYRLSSETTVEVYLNGEKRKSISREALAEYAKYLYLRIKEGGDKAFYVDRAEEIMGKLECEKIAAPSTDKTDITMQLHDVQTGYDPVCGFSIKSELGGAPTLLNASEATNFIFEIEGLTDQQMDEINAISTEHKILDRIERIQQEGRLTFKKANNTVFANNLMMIDSRMEEIIAEMLLVYYTNRAKECKAIVRVMEEENPLQFPRKGLYEYKMKKFLCSIALGMTPSKEWDGHDEANGGYIIVTTDGDVLAYHIYNRDFFESYLLEKTKFERGSTGKHKYASIYKEGGKMYINLNLQIRFKKVRPKK